MVKLDGYYDGSFLWLFHMAGCRGRAAWLCASTIPVRPENLTMLLIQCSFSFALPWYLKQCYPVAFVPVNFDLHLQRPRYMDYVC
jgi:hypothetical protein